MSAERSRQESLVRGQSPDWEQRATERSEGAGDCGGGSRPSKRNRPRASEVGERGRLHVDGARLGAVGLSEMGKVPMSTRPGDRLREECVVERRGEVRARSASACLNEWRKWMDDYDGAYIELESSAGETVQMDMLNSYHEERANKHYAKVKGLEREIEECWDGVTTVMLTFTASNRRDGGGFRAVGDHMRDVVGGWDSARKALSRVLSEFDRSCKLRIWEPHKSGYGHMHVAVFVEDPGQELEAADFEATMASHVRNCEPAGREAHRNTACDEHYSGDDWADAAAGCDDCSQPVSVSHGDEIGNLASYVCEYVAQFGESWDERELSEQMFLAASWATNTRRFNPDRTAQELMKRDLFRQSTGCDPVQFSERFERWRSDDKTARPESYRGNGDEDAHGGESGVTIDAEAEEVVVHGDGGGDGEGDSEGDGETWRVSALGKRREGGEDKRSPPPDSGGGGYMCTITDGPDHRPVDRGGW